MHIIQRIQCVMSVITPMFTHIDLFVVHAKARPWWLVYQAGVLRKVGRTLTTSGDPLHQGVAAPSGTLTGGGLSLGQAVIERCRKSFANSSSRHSTAKSIMTWHPSF